MIHEVDYSLSNTLTTRYVFLMLYITECQSCRLFKKDIYPLLEKELEGLDVVFYKSNCEKQTQFKHFPTFVLHDRHSNTKTEYRGAFKHLEMGKFIRDAIMKCTEARIVPYKRYTGGESTQTNTPNGPLASITELDVFLFDDLKERAQKADKVFIVLFYADWCNQCTLFKPTFANYAAENDSAIVGCFKDNGKYTAELFKTEGVVAVPTVKLFYKNETHEQKGSMTIETLRAFVRSNTKSLQSASSTTPSPLGTSPHASTTTPSSTTTRAPSCNATGEESEWTSGNMNPITENWKDDIQRMRDVGCLVLYYSTTCPFCEQIRPIFLEVAENESHLQVASVNVGGLRKEQRALLASEDITAVPTIVLYTKYASFLFDGENDAQSISRFVKHRMEQQQQTANDRRSLLQIQGGGFLKPKSNHGQSLFLFPDNNGMHAHEHRMRSA